MDIAEFGTLALLEPLIRRGVVTVDASRRDECCGMERDADGFCIYKPGHPIYMDPERAALIGRRF